MGKLDVLAAPATKEKLMGPTLGLGNIYFTLGKMSNATRYTGVINKLKEHITFHFKHTVCSILFQNSGLFLSLRSSLWGNEVVSTRKGKLNASTAPGIKKRCTAPTSGFKDVYFTWGITDNNARYTTMIDKLK